MSAQLLNQRKGIILEGGRHTHLHPIIQAVSKKLLPVYEKPMIFYPLSSFMPERIWEVLIITLRHNQYYFGGLLTELSAFGLVKCSVLVAMMRQPAWFFNTRAKADATAAQAAGLNACCVGEA